MANKNPCGKRVSKEDAYEVWQNDRAFSLGGQVFEAGEWTWYVLKKYQTPEQEALNPHARWHCLVVTPIVPSGEYGDVYVSDIVPFAKRIK